MADEITVVKTTGLGSRLLGSVLGVAIGIAMFFGSFVLLYWNEGRADISLIAKTAVELSEDGPAPSEALGKIVSISGVFQTEDRIGDGVFLKPAIYFAVQRQVEMYAWTQEEESHTTKNLGGSETTTTTYRYKTKWTSEPPSSDNFREPAGHTNPPMPLASEELRATSGSVGRFVFNLNGIELPSMSRLVLSVANVSMTRNAVLANGSYVYEGRGDLINPAVGDIRVSYEVLKPGFAGTLFGKLTGSQVTPYRTEKGETLFRIFDVDRDTAIDVLHQEYLFQIWLFRGLGFVAMWLGLSLFFGPLSTLLDIVPAFGAITRALAGIASFVIALPLTIVTILVSMLLHSLVALVVALLMTIGIIASVIAARKKRALAKQVAAV